MAQDVQAYTVVNAIHFRLRYVKKKVHNSDSPGTTAAYPPALPNELLNADFFDDMPIGSSRKR